MQNTWRATLLGVALTLGCVSAATADNWSQQTERANKWFDQNQGKAYQIQTPGQIQNAPGKIQTPGQIQVPRGIQAIKQSAATCQHRFVIGSDTLFEFDKYALSPGAEVTLKALGPMLTKQGPHPVLIEGHTDSVGTDDYNQRLSEKRAQSVTDWLSQHNYLTASAASARGYGKKRPVAPNANPDGSDNPAGRRKNRRVEIIVDTCKKLKAAASESGATSGQVQ